MEVGPKSQDPLLFQHSFCSLLTRLLGAQCLEPAAQGSQLICGQGRKRESAGVRSWTGQAGTSSLLCEISPAILPVPSAVPCKAALSGDQYSTAHSTTPTPSSRSCRSHLGGRLGLGARGTVLPTKQCQLEILSPLLEKEKGEQVRSSAFFPQY